MAERKRFQAVRRKQVESNPEQEQKYENQYKEAMEREFDFKQSIISIADQDLIKVVSVSKIQYIDRKKTKEDEERTIKKEKDIGGINDLHMGPTEADEICLTCFGNSKQCIGHPGHIELNDYFYHPAYLKDVALTLNSICSTCGSLLLTEEWIRNKGIMHKLTDIAMETLKATEAEKEYKPYRHVIKTGYKGVCGPQKYYDIKNLTTSTADTIVILNKEAAGKQIPFSAHDAYKLLSMMIKDDIQTLGFNITHPKNFIIKNLPVIPPVARFPAIVDGKAKDHPLTITYDNILKANAKYDTCKAGDKEAEKCRKDIHAEINKGIRELITKTGGNDAADKTVSIRTTIQSKEGLIRGASMGKRANYTGRTVLGPGPFLKIGQIGIPKSMAHNLTVKETVNEINIDYLQSLLTPDSLDAPIRISYIIKGRGKLEGKTIDIQKSRQRDYQLEYGDTVERWLEDGDYIIFNRQPTLHKYGMMGHEVVLTDDENIKLRLEESSAYNFDFDGDEGNIHAFQSFKAIFEAMSIAYVKNNIINGQIASPLIAATYDTLVSSYLLTKPFTIVAEPDRQEYLSVIVYRDQLKTLDARLKKYNINPNSGRALFSALLPVGFNYENEKVIIKDGILIDGVISKAHIGKSSNTIIQTMWKDDFLGPERAANFISDLAFLTNAWYKTQGFTVALSDLEYDNIFLKQSVSLEYEKAKFLADSLGPPPKDPLEHERWENNILSIVGSFKSVGSSIMEKLPDDNAFKIMAESGSKGDASNVAQMNGGLGQTMFMGKRLKFAITHGSRITAHYEPNSLDLDARGFIDSNFLEGLTAPELFMHFMWAREGILDTALKTGDTGYVHHKIVKHLEDNTVKYDGSVRNAAGRIIQFHYAEDGFNGAETMTLNTSYGKMTTFYNFKQQSTRLNRMFGF